MGKHKGKKSKIFKYAAIAFVIIFFISGALLFLDVWEKQQGRFPVYDSEEITVEFNGSKYILKDNVETVLVLGLDKNTALNTLKGIDATGLDSGEIVKAALKKLNQK